MQAATPTRMRAPPPASQEFLRLLLAHGCKPSLGAQDDINALHFAAQKGHAEALRHLINGGLHVNSRSRKGMTALMFATLHGARDAVGPAGSALVGSS